MKNLPQRVRKAQRKAPSPYKKFKKTPYLYSQEFRSWRYAARAKMRPDMSAHG